MAHSSGKITIHYKYSKENINQFCTALDSRLKISLLNNADKNFESFTTAFQASVDAGCKLAVPKTTKRNAVTNPWITSGLESNPLLKRMNCTIIGRNQFLINCKKVI